MRSFFLLFAVCSALLLRGQTLNLFVPTNHLQHDPVRGFAVVHLPEPVDLTGYSSVIVSSGPYAFQPEVTPEVLDYAQGYPTTVGDKLYFTRLPLLSITTAEDIPDEYKIPAQFTYVDGDQSYSGTVGVELRGGSSVFFPKKTFDLEFWTDETGSETVDFTPDGLRTDDDWILDALFNEPLRLRSHLAHRLWLDLHQPHYLDAEPEARAGADVRYVELFVNGRYRGIYNLSEQVDRKQLKLKKYDDDDEQVRGVLYKGIGHGTPAFEALLPYSNASPLWGGFEIKYPKADDWRDWGPIHELVGFVMNAPDAAFANDVWNRFHFGNAVDYYLFLNLLYATDNRGKNIYYAHYDTGTPLFMTPWDLDGCFGTDWGGNDVGLTDDLLHNGLYVRARALDPGNFEAALADRWGELRQTWFHTDTLLNRVVRHYNFLHDDRIYEREHWAHYLPVGEQTDLDYTLDWIEHRLGVLDDHFGLVSSTTPPTVRPTVRVFPQPAREFVTVLGVRDGRIPYQLLNAAGRSVRSGQTYDGERIDLRGLPAGMYFLRLLGHAPMKLVVR